MSKSQRHVKALQALRDKGSSFVEDYCTFRNRELWEVRCKGCGTIIRKMLPIEELSVKRIVRGVTLIQERLALACLANYREVLIAFDDGSKHVTPMCVECATTRLQDKDLLEAVYTADLEQWKREGAGVSEVDARRKPNRVAKVAEQIRGNE